MEQRIVADVRIADLMEYDRKLGGPRVSGTADAKRAAEYICATAKANGWDAHIEVVQPSWSTRNKTLYNVVAEHRGSAADGARKLLIAGAHFDTVRGAYGANDDGTGTSALLDATAALSHLTTNDDVRFVWFDGEEDGLLGSGAYVKAHMDELRSGRVTAMLQAEMLGSPKGQPTILYGDKRTRDAMTAPQEAAAAVLGHPARIEVDANAGSDHIYFARAGVPVAVICSTVPRVIDAEDPNYHRSTDTLENVNQQVFHDSSDVLAVTISRMAGASA
jgi:aminopeptidase S